MSCRRVFKGDFREVRVLGEGSFAKVYLAQNGTEERAVKAFKLDDQLSAEQWQKMIKREIDVLRNLSSVSLATDQ